ncbi:putative serine protease PepD [Streptomyces achromogenes]|uniref:Serine protease PepD n=1 Tax=Streptomyces achromogenes TaxID=67255 RepID=A0ABU0Q5Z0_STRAH|nr:trypsin-like peptidase domain-containing protein [Streptomyces achromogenes]MDQ0686092.1 putative serine protease PepD [Streptomyces achromogenes]
MDEGKPTKAKWWSRPRPQEPTGDRHTADDAGSAPAPPPPTPDGDFELARPAGPVDPVAAPASDEAPSTQMDGPAGPASGETRAHDAAPRREDGLADGASDAPGTADASHSDAPHGDAVPSDEVFGGTGSQEASAYPGADRADVVPVVESAAVPEPVAVERPKPLHDPDPYSTPPYGEPGPWAPAPPVQHPAIAAAPGGAATPGVTVPPSAPSALRQAAPLPPAPSAPSVPRQAAPLPPVPGPCPPPADPAPAIGTTPGTASAATSGTGAPGPGSAAMSGSADAPGPGSAAISGATASAASAATPATSGDVPVGASGAGSVDAQGAVPRPDQAAAPVPDADAAHGTIPAALADPGYLLASPAVSGSAPSAPSAPSGQSGQSGRDGGFDPWQRYDPWAAGSRLEAQAGGGTWQHSGAEAMAAGERRRRVRRQLVGGALAVALVSGVLGGAVGVYLERNGGLDPVRLPQASAEPAGRAADSVAGIAARALPSVVTLHVSGSDEGGTGTGFVLDSLGYILTNNHVVEPAGSDGGITVVFNGGQTAEAEVVGRDSGYDLAVVRVTGVKGLKPLYLGNSDNVRVGDPVVAIGAPFDLEGTVTSGIISAKERPITAGGDGGDADDVSYVDALQTDAPINPGNSGGPLLDAQGHVIGINSAIRSADDGVGAGNARSGSIGLGFAIPINQGKRVAEELINNGRATHPVIGVSLDLQYAGDGARISAKGGDGGPPVTAGGPGARAGLRAGDVVTQVDGQRVHSGEELIVRTRAHRPGDRLRLTILRDGAERTLTLVLGSSGGG